MYRIFASLLLSLMVGVSFGSVTAQDAPREAIKTITNYIVYYGQGRTDELATFDLAIVQPDTVTTEELAALREKGTLVVAYLSIGEAEPYRAWFSDGRVDENWLLGKNEDWDSYYADARQKGWQALMVTLMGEYLEKGFDGVFLDTVDTVDLFPETAQGMIDLIKGLREAYPDALLVQNRGFAVAEDTATAIDALMFEDLVTGYDFSTDTYIEVDNRETAGQMADFSERTGVVILALDYAAPDDRDTAAQAVAAARAYGFIPAVSVIALDDIPDYGLNLGHAEATLEPETTSTP